MKYIIQIFENGRRTDKMIIHGQNHDECFEQINEYLKQKGVIA